MGDLAKSKRHRSQRAQLRQMQKALELARVKYDDLLKYTLLRTQALEKQLEAYRAEKK